MKMQKKSLVVLLAGSLLMGSAAAMAFGGGHDFKGGDCGHGGQMAALEQLDGITDEQRDALRQLFKEEREGKREQHEAMRESRQAIRDAIDNGAGTEEIRALADKQGDRVADMIVERAAFRKKIAEILTEEQMKQLREHREERMERHHRW